MMNSVMFPLGFVFDSTSPGEILFIFGVILLLFGPKKLPEMARMVGRAMAEFRRASFEFRDQVMRMDEKPLDEPPRDKTPILPHHPVSDSDKPQPEDKKRSPDDLAG